jgi:membrane dipeptidase
MLPKILRLSLLILAFLFTGFFAFVPNLVDRYVNRTLHTSAPADKNSWYDSIPFIADLHCDALLWNRNLLTRSSYGHVDVPRMLEANVALEVFTVVTKTPRGINYNKNSDKTDQNTLLSIAQLRAPEDWFSLKSRGLHQCEQLHKFASDSKGEFRVIANKRELQKYIADRSTNHHLTAGLLGIEGAHCLEGDINNLNDFYTAGVRYIGLTHFFDNEWGGSAHGENKGGLTEKGKQLLHRMDSLHIITDLAHASPATISDIFKVTTGPLLVSHTGVKGTCDGVRNLSDEQIMEIGRRHGLIGIGLWETAVCGTDADATARSIKYVADKIGVDKVALGSDFDGATHSSYDITGFPVIVKALIKQGFTRPEIEQIMGGNVRDFLLRNLPD